MNLAVLKTFSASALCVTLLTGITPASGVTQNKPALKFRQDGSFKIVQFADIQDGPDTDPRTLALINNVLEVEKPDLVVLTGDNIDGKCKSRGDVRKAIDNIAKPFEKRAIPWAIVFGNHDDEHGCMTKEQMLKLYMSYPYNISQSGPKDIDGIGNYNLLVKGSKGNSPEFNIFMLDSGRYAPDYIGGYDWIKFSQVEWYRKTSLGLKQQHKKTIPALMFFHIPLPEFVTLRISGNITGERNENENPPNVNSGLFSSLLEMGDVKSVFVGHDHINDYVGDLYGIKLGYCRSAGYGTYGKEGFARGSRIFEISESNPGQIKTWSRLSTDFE